MWRLMTSSSIPAHLGRWHSLHSIWRLGSQTLSSDSFLMSCANIKVACPGQPRFCRVGNTSCSSCLGWRTNHTLCYQRKRSIWCPLSKLPTWSRQHWEFTWFPSIIWWCIGAWAATTLAIPISPLSGLMSTSMEFSSQLPLRHTLAISLPESWLKAKRFSATRSHSKSGKRSAEFAACACFCWYTSTLTRIVNSLHVHDLFAACARVVNVRKSRCCLQGFGAMCSFLLHAHAKLQCRAYVFESTNIPDYNLNIEDS